MMKSQNIIDRYCSKRFYNKEIDRSSKANRLNGFDNSVLFLTSRQKNKKAKEHSFFPATLISRTLWTSVYQIRSRAGFHLFSKHFQTFFVFVGRPMQYSEQSGKRFLLLTPRPLYRWGQFCWRHCTCTWYVANCPYYFVRLWATNENPPQISRIVQKHTYAELSKTYKLSF